MLDLWKDGASFKRLLACTPGRSIPSSEHFKCREHYIALYHGHEFDDWWRFTRDCIEDSPTSVTAVDL